MPEALVTTLQDFYNIMIEVSFVLTALVLLFCCLTLVFRGVVQPEWEKFSKPTMSLLHEMNERLAILVNNSFY